MSKSELSNPLLQSKLSKLNTLNARIQFKRSELINILVYAPRTSAQAQNKIQEIRKLKTDRIILQGEIKAFQMELKF